MVYTLTSQSENLARVQLFNGTVVETVGKAANKYVPVWTANLGILGSFLTIVSLRAATHKLA